MANQYKAVKLTAAQKTVLSGAWSYDQAALYVKEMLFIVGDGWDWMVPQVREALVAAEAFSVARSQHKATVEVRDMDLLLNAMQVAAGLRKAE